MLKSPPQIVLVFGNFDVIILIWYSMSENKMLLFMLLLLAYTLTKIKLDWSTVTTNIIHLPALSFVCVSILPLKLPFRIATPAERVLPCENHTSFPH